MRAPAHAAAMLAASTLSAVVLACPGLALACPMCFSGNNTNQSAFLYGSLMLMIVPTVTIGGLLYWVYRRAKAIDDATTPVPPANTAAAPSANPASEPALRVIPGGETR